MKQWLYLLLLCIFIGGVFVGCGNQGGENIFQLGGQEYALGDTGGLTLPLTTENETLSYLVTSGVSDLNNKYIIQVLREVTGVNLQVEAYPASTVNEKVKMLVAAKTLPDLIGAGLESDEAINDLGVQGAFVSIDDRLDLMPNLKALIYDNEEHNWFFKSYQAEDGHTYVIPLYDFQRDVNHGMLYRKDIFDKHGISLWEGPEEFYDRLKQLKTLYPDSVPFTSKNQENIFNQLSVSWGLNAYLPYYDEEEKIWKHSDTDPLMKEILDFVRKMVQEELFDPEFLTLTQAAWTQKMTQEEKAFVTFDWIGRLEMFKTQTAETLPEYDLRYAPPIGPKGTVVSLPKIGTGSAASNRKNHELALQFSDFLLSEAGAELITMGVEGETYVLDENGMAQYLEFEKDYAITINDLEEKYGMFLQGMYKRFDRRSIYFNYTEREQEAQDFAVKNNRFEPADPKLLYTNEEKEILTGLMPNLRKASSEFFIQYVLTENTGQPAWDAWIEKFSSLGANQVIDIYNQAQVRYEQ